MDLKRTMAMLTFILNLEGTHQKRNLEVPKPPKLEREDSRQYMQPDEVRPKIVVSHGRRYRPSSRSVKFRVPPQNIDMPPHLRSCSSCCPNARCPEAIQIEGVPDIPWYLRLFTCCCCR